MFIYWFTCFFFLSFFLSKLKKYSYFKTEKAVTKEKKWTQFEKDLLIQGIEQYGIGYFSEISQNLLPEWVSEKLWKKNLRKKK